MAKFDRVWFFGRVATLALATSACSVHPLPEDVSRVTTFDIVERIRCEAQEGLRSFTDVDAWRIAGVTRVGLQFTFNMTAMANANIADLDFKKANLTHSFKLDTGAGGGLTRHNVRSFQVLERLIEVDDYECAGKASRKNLAHPVTGRIGLHEVIQTYMQLEKQTNLAKAGDTVFSDSLEFTTNYDFGVTTTWQVNAPLGSLRLEKLSLSAGVERRDFHTLTVILTRDAVPAAGRNMSSFDKGELRALIDSQSIRDPRSQVALVQKETDAHTRALLEMDRLRMLNDTDRVAARVLGQRMLDILKLP